MTSHAEIIMSIHRLTSAYRWQDEHFYNWNKSCCVLLPVLLIIYWLRRSLKEKPPFCYVYV